MGSAVCIIGSRLESGTPSRSVARNAGEHSRLRASRRNEASLRVLQGVVECTRCVSSLELDSRSNINRAQDPRDPPQRSNTERGSDIFTLRYPAKLAAYLIVEMSFKMGLVRTPAYHRRRWALRHAAVLVSADGSPGNLSAVRALAGTIVPCAQHEEPYLVPSVLLIWLSLAAGADARVVQDLWRSAGSRIYPWQCLSRRKPCRRYRRTVRTR